MCNFNKISFICCSQVMEFLDNIKFSSTQNSLVCYYYELFCINSWFQSNLRNFIWFINWFLGYQETLFQLQRLFGIECDEWGQRWFAKRQSENMWKYYPSICMERLRKTIKPLSGWMLAGTGNRLNTWPSPELNCQTNLFHNLISLESWVT